MKTLNEIDVNEVGGGTQHVVCPPIDFPPCPYPFDPLPGGPYTDPMPYPIGPYEIAVV